MKKLIFALILALTVSSVFAPVHNCLPVSALAEEDDCDDVWNDDWDVDLDDDDDDRDDDDDDDRDDDDDDDCYDDDDDDDDDCYDDDDDGDRDDEGEDNVIFFLDDTPVMFSECDFDASSYYKQNKPSVAPEMAFDTDSSTSWDSWDDYEGAWIQVELPDQFTINGFSIISGKPARNGSRDYYYRNSRPEQLNVYVDDELVGTFELKDTWCIQSFSFDEPVKGTSVRFEVGSVYEGTMYSSPNYGVCVSELCLF